MGKHHIYIAQCSDGTYYTGYAVDVDARIDVHNSGKGAKYTRARRPVTLKYTECFNTKSEALKREYEIKQFTRVQKEALMSEVKR
ncbi:GIY-YIG nuclease family protein [Nosocomiicoccus ampullae]|uniref:GIY-YIG nuclease family protein n=1 Tax=Nosocomiicoccus ampullae TaxID=489910 RepID=UPI002549D42C|nr:GIY-YIG nuclease family protein [Nosocomiicoccus ampullae]MDK6864093.1 GIY-YIG nuclease family protein [Nosocomiicoccus ampullae]